MLGFFSLFIQKYWIRCKGLARKIVAHNFLEKDKGDPAKLKHVELKKEKKNNLPWR